MRVNENEGGSPPTLEPLSLPPLSLLQRATPQKQSARPRCVRRFQIAQRTLRDGAPAVYGARERGSLMKEFFVARSHSARSHESRWLLPPSVRSSSRSSRVRPVGPRREREPRHRLGRLPDRGRLGPPVQRGHLLRLHERRRGGLLGVLALACNQEHPLPASRSEAARSTGRSTTRTRAS